MNDPQQPLNALPQGHRLQEYELVRVLGFGGFGMTYLGFDHNLDKAVAIKEYLPSDIATRTSDNSVVPQASQFRDDFEWGLGRFLDEARALARFDHRHIIKVHRFFEAHGTAYIVMEYAEGETLSAFLERKGTLKEAELKAILYPLLDGLEVVHGADFLHRDIKPGNIIIRDEDNSPVLLDFGSARQAIGTRSRSVTSIITPGYAPIEQYSSRGDQGPWTDIYALGGVCYRALTGEVPDDATDRMRNDPIIPVVERCARQASAKFLSAIDWALTVDEGGRPQIIAEWRAKLEGREKTTSAPLEEEDQERDDAPPVHPPKNPKGKLFAVVACLFALLIGGVYYYQYEYLLNQRRQTQEAVEAEAVRERAERVSALLSGAAKDMAADRLTSPAGANAWEKYQAVLELVPGHVVATAGLDRIIRRYVSKFESALGRKDFDKAGEYMSRIRMVHADAPVLSEMADRLSAVRQAEVERQREAEAAARALQRPSRRFKDCAECPLMIGVPAGSFTMGSPSGEYGRDSDEGPQHLVRIGYGFAVGVYEVTFSEWEACVSDGGCNGYRPDDRGWGRGNRPVINVSWEDAESYVGWLSAKTGESYRLLSESEWEYVARAGTETKYSWGNEIGDNLGNCYGCGSRWDYEQTATVGSYSANSFGLYDVHGNVWEWVQDCYNDNYRRAPSDGSAWESGDCSERVLRGGCWFDKPSLLRSAGRGRLTTGRRGSFIGFRVARSF